MQGLAKLLGRIGLFALLLNLGGPALAATEQGYIELPDGVGLKYTVLLPEGEGPFPTLLHYQGYGAGADPNDNGLILMSPRMMDAGFAILGVSLRGTGCSEGDFDLFESQWVDDGVVVIDWASQQSWSDGQIAMVGLSFPGMTQMMVGPMRPPALKALLPWSAMTDIYRDVAYPGGIFNASFASAWTGIQKQGQADTPVELSEGDTRCAAALAQQNDPAQIVFVQGQTNPWADAPLYERFVPENTIGQINVPVLFAHGWQDEQISGRTIIDYEQLDQSQTWHVYGNGTHGFGLGSALVLDTAEAFLRHYLLGEDNGFANTPKVQIEHEVYFGAGPTWVDHYADFPVPTRLAELYFHADGRLLAERPAGAGQLDYAYPLPAPSMTAALAAQTENQSYALPVPEGGAVHFTSPALAHDLEWFGPARVELDLASTAPDTDVQISLSEVRPDGQQMFVQRGWLRASHQALDPLQSRANMPHHTHLEADAQALALGEARRLSIEIWPVAHVFRAGSSLRISVEAPLGTTGFRQLELNPTPAMNSVHLGGDDPSRIIFSLRPDAAAPKPLGPCLDRMNQPCRDDSLGQPAGELNLPAARALPAIAGAAHLEGGLLQLSNHSDDTHYLRALTLAITEHHTLSAISLSTGQTTHRIEQPPTSLRFELAELALGPGEQLSLTVDVASAASQGVISRWGGLGNIAHAHHAITLPSLAGPHVWLIALLLAAVFTQGRRSLVLLALSGVLVACSGGRAEAPQSARAAAAPAIEVSNIEVVDSRGQYRRYSIR